MASQPAAQPASQPASKPASQPASQLIQQSRFSKQNMTKNKKFEFRWDIVHNNKRSDALVS
jgi:hypothetical protein